MARGRKRAPGAPAPSAAPVVTTWWKVTYAGGWLLVEADSEDGARENFQAALPNHLKHKPWLLRDLVLTRSTASDRELFASMTKASPLTRQKLGLTASATPKGYAQ